jgi:carboxypeptidase family protein
MKNHHHDSSRTGRRAATGLFLLSLLTVVCISGGGVSVAHAQAAYKTISVTDGGTIQGTVTLKGGMVKPARLDVTQDNKTCGKTKPLSCLCVGKKSGVANTFVYLDGITAGKPFERLSAYTLHQQQCEYVPHAMIMPLGAQLEIVNNDPILHNVHTYLDGKPAKTLFNIAQPMKGIRMKSPRPIDKPGLVLATCDAGHPWMSAHIMVAPHPYYAVTDADGNFRLENVPPGNYTLQLWHEGIAVTSKVLENGKVSKYEFEEPYIETKPVTVAPKQETVVDFELVLR